MAQRLVSGKAVACVSALDRNSELDKAITEGTIHYNGFVLGPVTRRTEPYVN